MCNSDNKFTVFGRFNTLQCTPNTNTVNYRIGTELTDYSQVLLRKLPTNLF